MAETVEDPTRALRSFQRKEFGVLSLGSMTFCVISCYFPAFTLCVPGQGTWPLWAPGASSVSWSNNIPPPELCKLRGQGPVHSRLVTVLEHPEQGQGDIRCVKNGTFVFFFLN